MDTVSCMASNCVAFHTANSIHNSLSLRSCLNVSDQVSHPYKTTGKIIVLYILIFFLYCLKTFTSLGATETKTELPRSSYNSWKQALVTYYHNVQVDCHNHEDN